MSISHVNLLTALDGLLGGIYLVPLSSADAVPIGTADHRPGAVAGRRPEAQQSAAGSLAPALAAVYFGRRRKLPTVAVGRSVPAVGCTDVDSSQMKLIVLFKLAVILAVRVGAML